MTDINGKLFALLRRGVVLCLMLGLIGGLLLPLYSDEVGWRLQERAWIDGLDKLYSDQCGPGTLAVPPFFMMPARWFSAFFNLRFAQPYWVRVSGVAYALAWVGLMLALVRRVARDAGERNTITVIACTLMGLGCTPLLMVWSRPEQPILLAMTGALVIAATGWRSPGIVFSPLAHKTYADAPVGAGTAWRRSLMIAALGVIALSYHFKGLITMPVFAAAVVMASRGPRTHAPRAVALSVLVGAGVMSLHYWTQRLACPMDPLVDFDHRRQNIAATIMAGGGLHQGLGHLVWTVLANLEFSEYIHAAAPQVHPMSQWLVNDRVSVDEMTGWRDGMKLIWALCGALSLVGAVVALWRQGRRLVLACEAAMALILWSAAALWCASQTIRHDYEVSFMLPMMALAVVMGLAAPHGLGWLSRAVPVVALGIGPLMILSEVLVAGLYGPPMIDALAARAYLPAQPYSVPLMARAHSENDIVGAAALCGMAPGRGSNVMIDDVTYFSFMANRLPQHWLGILPNDHRGIINDPLAYLKQRHSAGIIMGCHQMTAPLRARAKARGDFCCIAPQDFSPLPEKHR